MHALLLAIATVVSSGALVDPGTVQEAYVYELNVPGKGACKASVDKGGQLCASMGRRFELLRGQRELAFKLMEAQQKQPQKACAAAPTHAFVLKTTKGTKGVDVSFACHSFGGRALSSSTEKELASFLRSFGLVYGL